MPNPKGYPFSGMTGTPHEGDWGVIPGLAEADYDDADTVDYVIEVLGQKKGIDLSSWRAASFVRTYRGMRRNGFSISIL